eukprot:scaffold117257_cov39-Attheya_sp.AAC.1
MGPNCSPSSTICQQAVEICLIKYFQTDSTGTPMEIDPNKISAMNHTSTDSESEIYHEALEDTSSTPIEPTIKQFQQN